MVIRDRGNAEPAYSGLQRRRLFRRTEGQELRDIQTAAESRTDGSRSDNEIPPALLGAAAVHCRSYVHGSDYHLPFRTRALPLQGQREMVAADRHGHSHSARMGQSFYVVHQTVVRICPALRQVQDSVHGPGDSADHAPGARIHGTGQDIQRRIRHAADIEGHICGLCRDCRILLRIHPLPRTCRGLQGSRRCGNAGNALGCACRRQARTPRIGCQTVIHADSHHGRPAGIPFHVKEDDPCSKEEHCCRSDMPHGPVRSVGSREKIPQQRPFRHEKGFQRAVCPKTGGQNDSGRYRSRLQGPRHKRQYVQRCVPELLAQVHRRIQPGQDTEVPGSYRPVYRPGNQ